MGIPEKIVVENVNTPGRTGKVDAAKYNAVKRAMLKVLPDNAPGLTHAELCTAMKPHLEELFPGGAKIGWWSKTVQLDLEAKKVLYREDSKPLRWHQQKPGMAGMAGKR